MTRMMSATIRGGVAVSDDFAGLPDGTALFVVAPETDDYELTPEEDAELVARIEKADQGGPFVSAEEVLRDFDERRRLSK